MSHALIDKNPRPLKLMNLFPPHLDTPLSILLGTLIAVACISAIASIFCKEKRWLASIATLSVIGVLSLVSMSNRYQNPPNRGRTVTQIHELPVNIYEVQEVWKIDYRCLALIRPIGGVDLDEEKQTYQIIPGTGDWILCDVTLTSLATKGFTNSWHEFAPAVQVFKPGANTIMKPYAPFKGRE